MYNIQCEFGRQCKFVRFNSVFFFWFLSKSFCRWCTHNDIYLNEEKRYFYLGKIKHYLSVAGSAGRSIVFIFCGHDVQDNQNLRNPPLSIQNVRNSYCVFFLYRNRRIKQACRYFNRQQKVQESIVQITLWRLFLRIVNLVGKYEKIRVLEPFIKKISRYRCIDVN